MSRSILTTMPAFATYAGLKLEVSIAFGADVTSLTGSGWTWTDVTDDVIIGGQAGAGGGSGGGGTGENAVSITIGRADESSVTQTSVMKCTLDNRSGKYINTGQSAYWPYVRRGTPVRVRVTTDNGSTWSIRFQGSAVGFTPSWDTPGRWTTVELEASGPLRVLDQGTLPAISAMRYGTLRDTKVVAYWPLEDEQQSKNAMPAIGGTPGNFRTWDYSVSGSVDGVPGQFASYTNIPSSAPCLTMALGGALLMSLPVTTGSTSTFSALFGNPAGVPTSGNRPDLAGIPNTGVILTAFTPNGGSIKCWEIGVQTGGNLVLQGYSATGAPARLWPSTGRVFSQAVAFGLKQNTDYEIGLTLSQSGSTTSWDLWIMEIATGITSHFNSTQSNSGAGAQIDQVRIGEFSDAVGLGAGHMVVRAPSMAVGDDASWVTGYPGEAVTTRLPRIANQRNVNVDLLAPGAGIYPAYTETANSITLTCGPQFWDTVSNTLRETEVTGQGLLYDGLGTGLTFVTRRFRQQRAAAATLTLDASSGHLMEPWGPIDDDQVLFNHYTVSRHGGNQGVEYLDQTGLEGTNIVGDHSSSLTVNPNVDAGLVGYAQWGVNLGTVTGFRFPTVSFVLHTNASLIPQWLACVPQSRIDVTNITAIRPQLSPDPIWLLLEGWTETISMFEWSVVANTSSAEPWLPTRLAAATGSTGDDICHMDTDSSQLNTSVSAGATSISVRTNSGPLWVQSASDADSFPFYITVGGLRVQVTAITGAASPQTFTLASPGLAAAKTGSTTPGAGAPISIWRPPVLGL